MSQVLHRHYLTQHLLNTFADVFADRTTNTELLENEFQRTEIREGGLQQVEAYKRREP